MPNPHKTVFISYRRKASSYVAQAIFQHLRAKRYNVFMDVASIDSGTFDTIILNQIAARAHFLIICTPGTFERCNEPDDWLRREIETAMDLQRNIVPVLTNGFTFEDNLRHLTGRLVGLPRLNTLPLYHEYFDEGMVRLRDRYLKQPVAGALLPTPLAERAIVADKIKQAAAMPTLTREELLADRFFYRAFRRMKDDLEGQIADYSEAIRFDPKLAAAYLNRAFVREKQNDLQRAIADYSDAFRLEPRDATALSNRGEAYFTLGQYPKAREDFKAALKLNATSKYALAGLAITLHELGRNKDAFSRWRKLVKADARYVDADWVGMALNWRPELVEAARKLIAELNP